MTIELQVSLADQSLRVEQDGRIERVYRCSTASKGPGQHFGSEQTPLGRHIVRARIGAGLPPGSVLVGRRPSGEVYNAELAQQYPQRDWILSRILWLSGTQLNVNRLGQVDTMRRYIYIHGTPDTEPMGTALSHGCIRMRNDDVIDLFDRTPVGTVVNIVEESLAAAEEGVQ